jgi:hypothetical protein
MSSRKIHTVSNQNLPEISPPVRKSKISWNHSHFFGLQMKINHRFYQFLSYLLRIRIIPFNADLIRKQAFDQYSCSFALPSVKMKLVALMALCDEIWNRLKREVKLKIAKIFSSFFFPPQLSLLCSDFNDECVRLNESFSLFQPRVDSGQKHTAFQVLRSKSTQNSFAVNFLSAQFGYYFIFYLNLFTL